MMGISKHNVYMMCSLYQKRIVLMYLNANSAKKKINAVNLFKGVLNYFEAYDWMFETL